METKLCKNCKHGKRDFLFGWEFAKCTAIKDSVAGKPRFCCVVERDPYFDSINECGSTGKLWEQKPSSAIRRILDWLFGYLR